jgi:NADPH-dependent 2,4-dienoyl-CoA reductase/sulfur reductase-like enzyme
VTQGFRREGAVDPFLFAHKRTGVPLFDLSIRLNTISVRDQMTRALLLAERLPAWLQTQLGVNYAQHRVLVVGGGACGMTAAVALTRRGMTVEVAERDGHLFNLQRNCIVDPTFRTAG